ncbi:MAG: transcription termination/antitermination NusG family protein [Lentisphaeria bacterium]|nr:transcription termination/antitermination NusG family protein [Lentisphaeria bacterium]
MTFPVTPIDHHDGWLWTPVRVRPRTEKVVARYCEDRGIRFYLPLWRKVSRHQRRTVESFLPLFPGYLFAQLGPTESEDIVLSHKIVRIFRMDTGAESILIDELRSLQIIEQANVTAEPLVAPELVAGTRVEITDGPLRGLIGMVEKRGKTTRVCVNVDMLGQSVTVDLDVGELAVSE